MKNNIDPHGELKELIGHRQGLCASLILPVHDIASEKNVDRLEIDHAIEKLKTLFSQMNKPDSEILKKIDELKEQAKQIKGENGLGIFASHDVAKLTTFPFDVKERIVVGDSFEIRDLVEKERYDRDYFVLLFGGKSTQLFRGKENNLTEISDLHFPATFDGIDYEIPDKEIQGVNSSHDEKRDLSVTTQSAGAFYNHIDSRLNEYLNEQTPLLLAGTEKELARFEKHSRHCEKVKGKIQGSYNHSILTDLEKEAWQVMKVHIRKEERELLHRLRNIGREFVSAGIRDVWNDVKQGRGNILLVERDLELTAYTDQTGSELQLSPTPGTKKEVPDAVDDVIEAMLQKKGNVIFVENGLLKEYGGIAMMNRY
jgi:hypothetical protein